jgi:hypothetical protein
MAGDANWDWEVGRKTLADVSAEQSQDGDILETTVSPDGERAALLLVGPDGACTASVNGKPWPRSFEKLWHLRFSPLGQLIGLAMDDSEWTLAVDGQTWEQSFEYLWEPHFSADGRRVGAIAKRDNLYAIAVDGEIWDESYHMIRDFCLNADGSRSAATVQIGPRKEADVEGFFAGAWTVVVDGKPWGDKYVNAWGPA